MSASSSPKEPFVWDPVHLWKGAWYFWDEDGKNRVGPFMSEKLARKALLHYAETR